MLRRTWPHFYVNRYTASEYHVPACRRIKVADCPAVIPDRWFEELEYNQQIATCCRKPRGDPELGVPGHEIEAWHSSAEQRDGRVLGGPRRNQDAGYPDIYVFHCTGCGRQHRRFMVGGPMMLEGIMRPQW